jgi:hypothetical protein
VSKTIVWSLVTTLVLVALAVSSIRCSAAPVDPGGFCVVDADCDVVEWGGDCRESEGHWECDAQGVCDPICDPECNTVADCIGEWTQACAGRFACEQGECQQPCDSVTCGDGTCDTTGGETKQSCPADCDQPCEAPADCTDGHEWDAPCEGRWECQSQTCFEFCDYISCGDGACNSDEGENEDSCPGDCLEGCRIPSDCFSEQWAPGAICQGRWNCLPSGECDRVCDETNCGDGVCWGLNGENEDSCFRDCLGGPCEGPIDCLAHRWYEPCGGHWECVPPMPPAQLATGACEAVCDAGGCGDGICDSGFGETPVSCLIDCAGYSCTRSEDCSALTLPIGCTGDWICSSLICVAQCE